MLREGVLILYLTSILILTFKRSYSPPFFQNFFFLQKKILRISPHPQIDVQTFFFSLSLSFHVLSCLFLCLCPSSMCLSSSLCYLCFSCRLFPMGGVITGPKDDEHLYFSFSSRLSFLFLLSFFFAIAYI